MTATTTTSHDETTTRTLTTAKGKSVETHLTDEGAMAILLENWETLSEFGTSLVRKHERYGLSYDQKVWTHVLALSYVRREEWEAEDDKTHRFERIPAILSGARDKGLKFPKIRLETEDGQKVVLGLAGGRAKFPGSVNVTDGRPYGENTWFGRIHTDGRFEASASATQAIQDLLGRFDENPADAGKVHGALTGNCCFCGRHLETRESVASGYGPVCADRYGLPWTAEGYEGKRDEAAKIERHEAVEEAERGQKGAAPSLSSDAADALAILNG